MKKIIACNLKLDLPQCQAPYTLHMPYGLGTIIEILSKNSVKLDCYDTYITGSSDNFLKYYKRYKHDVLLFSAIIGNKVYKFFKYLFSNIKEINPNSTIILGGPITSVYPEFLLEYLPVDIIVIGEGEETIIELLENDFKVDDNLLKINGLGFSFKGEFILTPKRKALKTPLEEKSLSPLFSHNGLKVLLDHYTKKQISNKRGWDLTATRGCVHNCSFCKKVFDKPIRVFSPEYIINFMTFIYEKFGINRISFLDENFTTNKNYICRFLDLIEESKYHFDWRMRSRIDNFPIDYIDRMIELGMYSQMMGIESGSQTVLNYYNKKIFIEDYIDILVEVSKKTTLHASFIIGAEVETKETIKETIDLIKRINLRKENIYISYLTPIPGTKIFEDLCKKNVIKDKKEYIINYMGDYLKLEHNISSLTDNELHEAKESLILAGR